MIRVYTAPGSQSCRKVIAWLKEHNLSFIEKNIFSSDLHANELREILERCENGTDDILSKNSKIIKSNNTKYGGFYEGICFIRPSFGAFS